MKPWLRPLEWLMVTLWAGSLWTIGYVVAPGLFASLDDKVLAGNLAGGFFKLGAWISMVCAGLFMLTRVGRASVRDFTIQIVILMLLCTLINHFGLQPKMELLRVHAFGPIAESPLRREFGIYHGISSTLYLMQSVLAVWLVIRVSKGK